MPPHVGFNPCCTGLAISAAWEALDLEYQKRFQSLLYWISHFGETVIELIDLAPVFQSLLYWISHFGANLAPQLGASSGFNPCCTGLAISARGLKYTLTTIIWFQSLLYWISHFGFLVPEPWRCPVAAVSILVVLD